MIRVPKYREPTHPGRMLLEEFLQPMGITQQRLANEIHVPYQRINEIVNKRRGVTPSTALRLSKYFGNSPDFWLTLQMRWELFQANKEESGTLKEIKRVSLPQRTPTDSRPITSMT